MDGLTTNSLASVRSKIGDLRIKTQHDGKSAFDRIDPAAARLQASRLEQIDRAETLLGELETLLGELGVEWVSNDSGDSVENAGSDGNDSDLSPTHHKPNTSRPGKARLADGPALHPPQLAEPVIDVLREIGGSGHLRDIWAGIERKLGHRFTKADLEKMKSANSQRWQYNVQWTLTNLKNDGRVEHGGKRGVWKLVVTVIP